MRATVSSGTRQRVQDGGHGHQRLVAGLMAVGVVDLFKEVDVEQHHRQVAVMAPRARQVRRAVFEERAPVAQFRQRIGHGLFREPVPALLEFADGARELVVHVHTRLQFEFVDRLGDEVVGAVEEREVAVDVVVGRGHDDHWQVAQPGVVTLADLDQQLVTGQVRHLDVGEDQFNRRAVLQQLPGLGAVFGVQDAVTAGEIVTHERRGRQRILHQQNLRRRARLGAWGGQGRSGGDHLN